MGMHFLWFSIFTPRTASTRRCARPRASSIRMSRSTTTNSSPPSRATRSPRRGNVRTRRSATTFSASSPAPCPQVSLIDLKRSTSIITRQTGCEKSAVSSRFSSDTRRSTPDMDLREGVHLPGTLGVLQLKREVPDVARELSELDAMALQSALDRGSKEGLPCSWWRRSAPSSRVRLG